MDPSWETQVVHRQDAMLAINVIEIDSFSVDAQAESSRLSHIEVGDLLGLSRDGSGWINGERISGLVILPTL